MTEPKSPLSAGLIVAGSYDIERLLGQGGMGEVWLARHLRLAGKQVAIKVLRTAAEAPSTELLARFRREAEIAARLEHPNIVQVLDFNQLPTGEPYLVMEYLKGESLADRLRRSGGALTVEQMQGIVLQVGSALQAAHLAGVVHRDLKPDNIFLVPTSLGDQIKVLDFGISKLSQTATVQTTEQTLLGTPLYMSPEQALGQHRETTGQSDLFSLGSICYEMLTGTAPFVAESIAQVVFRIAYQAHLPLRQVMPSLPVNVIDAIEHALVKDRAGRTADIATFIRELTFEELVTRPGDSGVYSPGMAVSDSLLLNKTAAPVGSGKVTPFARPAMPATRRLEASATKKNPGRVALIASALIIAAGAGGALVWQRSRPTTMVTHATPVALDAGLAIEVAKSENPVLPRADPSPGQRLAAPSTAMVANVGETTKRAAELKPGLTGDDARLVGELKTLRAGHAWEQLSQKRSSAYNSCHTSQCRREVMLLALEATCALKDLQAAKSLVRRFDDDDIDARTRAKQACRPYFPDWE